MCIVAAVIALPWAATAQVAEAVGCRAALALLEELQPWTRRARVVGDNLAVVRYGAGTARLRRPEIQAQLDAGLAAALAGGWRLERLAVRRRLSGVADAVSPRGLAWAAQLRAEGRLGVHARTEWAPVAADLRAPPPSLPTAALPVFGAPAPPPLPAPPAAAAADSQRNL